MPSSFLSASIIRTFVFAFIINNIHGEYNGFDLQIYLAIFPETGIILLVIYSTGKDWNEIE